MPFCQGSLPSWTPGRSPTSLCRSMCTHEPGKQSLREIVDRLAEAYGVQGWWPAKDRFEIIVGAILTQRVSWANVERAIARLREAQLLSVDAMLSVPQDVLSELIRPSLYHNAKAGKLLAFCRFVDEHGGAWIGLDDLLALPAAELRSALMSVHGIGPETADAIVLYAAGKPTFVVDAYARQILTRIGWLEPNTSDEAVRHQAVSDLSCNVALLGEAHALLVEHGKRSCRKRNPDCQGCVLRVSCTFGHDPSHEACR